jgi:hypothetical protein
MITIPESIHFIPELLCKHTLNQEGHAALEPVVAAIQLGLPEMALEQLDHLPEEESALEAGLRLLAMELSGARASTLADLALLAARRFADNMPLLETATIHLTVMGRYQEVLELCKERFTRLVDCHHACILHNIAVAYAQLRNFELALLTADHAIRFKSSPGGVLADMQMQPLWEHYAQQEKLTLIESRCLTSWNIQVALDELQSSRQRVYICEWTLNHRLPYSFHPWMERCVSGNYYPKANTSPSMRESFRFWCQKQATETAKLVGQAISNAASILESNAQQERRAHCLSSL